MIGISGGGWTTTLAAAIDPRIKISISVADSLPLYLRTPPCAAPDEPVTSSRIDPSLLSIADYLDLYVLGSYGRGRAHLQVLNQYDPCCFAGVRYLTYSDIVKDIVNGLGAGRYEVFLDSSHDLHQISEYALQEAIYPFLRRHRR